MNTKKFNATLDMQNLTQKSAFSVVTNDIGGNVVDVALVNNGKTFDITGYTNITFTARKPNNTFYVDSEGENVTVMDEVKGRLTLILPHAAIDIPGVYTATIEVYCDTTRITSARFNYTAIAGLADGLEPSDDPNIPLLQQLILDVNEAVTNVNEAVAAEDLRADAEAARVVAETGRVTAEAARVAAENAREVLAQEISNARQSAVKSKAFETLDARLEEAEQDHKTHTAESVTQAGGVHGLIYEEGTWTPNIIFGEEGIGITYDRHFGTYTKIGNIVNFEIDIVLTNKGTSTGIAGISGFPLVSATDNPIRTIPLGDIQGITISGMATVFLMFAASQTLAYFRSISTSGTTVALTENNFSNSSRIFINGFYRID